MLGSFNIDRVVYFGLLQLVSEPWYRFWEEIKRGCSLIYCRMVPTRQEIRTDLSSARRGNRDIDSSEGQEESPLEDTASHAPKVSTQVGHEELTGPQIRQAPRQTGDVRPTMSTPRERV